MARNKVLGAIAAVLLAACLAPGAALADDAALVAGEQAFGSSAGQESQIVVVFKPGTGKAKAARSVMSVESVEGQAGAGTLGGKRFALVDVKEGANVADTARALADDPSVAYVQPNFHYTLASAEAERVRVNDPLVSSERQWHIDSIGARDAWEYAKAEGKVTVAVIDTGIQMNHIDLKDGIVAPYDVTGDARSDTTASVPDESPDDRDGHGTHVAGVVAGRTNNGIGISGVSYNANIMPIRVFYHSNAAGQSVADSIDIAAAYEYLLSRSSGDINGDGKRGTIAEEYNVRVANMSLGGLWSSGEAFSDTDQLILDMIDKADDAGVLTVCAAGNDSVNSRHFPGDYDKCVSVIALDADNSRAYYSNYGPDKDIAAPGTNIYSTLNRSWGQAEGESFTGPDGADYYYGRMSGTSMASPVVAGVAALMFASNGNLSPDRVKRALYETADDLGDAGRDDQFGWGKVNAAAAVKAVAYTAVTGIDCLPESICAGEKVKLEGAVLPATASRTGITYSVVDDGGTGAYVDGDELVAARPGTCLCRATVVGGIDLGTDYFQGFAVRVVATDIGAIDLDVTGIEAAYSYQGKAVEPDPALVCGGRALVRGVDYVLSYRENLDVGTARVIVSGRGGYCGKRVLEFEIVPAQLSDAKFGTISDRAYTGRAQIPGVFARMGDRFLVPGIDYQASYRDNVNVGAAHVTLSGCGNFRGTYETGFDIVKYDSAGNPVREVASKAPAASAARLSVSSRVKAVKAGKLKKKAASVKPFAVKGARGAVRFKKVGGSKVLKVKAKTGAVTVAKGAKRGVYKIRVKVTSGGSVTVATAKVRVK